MSAITTVCKRELRSYFATPVAYVFIVIFLVLSSAFTFYLGGFYERGQADLLPFFNFLPWLYLFLVPAVSMRLWSEERKSGTIELLLTLPITMWQAVMGKFLAAWAFIGIALALPPAELGPLTAALSQLYGLRMRTLTAVVNASMLPDEAQWQQARARMEAFGAPVVMGGGIGGKFAKFYYLDTGPALGYVTEVIHPDVNWEKGPQGIDTAMHASFAHPLD